MVSYLFDLTLWNMNYNHKLMGNVKNFHKNTVIKYFFLPKTKKGFILHNHSSYLHCHSQRHIFHLELYHNTGNPVP